MDSNTPRVLVHEYFTGGGWPEDGFPKGMAAEGLAMLKAILNQFDGWGRARVVTTLDSRLSPKGIKASEIITLHHKDYPDNLAEAIQKSDAALIIAPEDDGILARLNRRVLEQQKILLGAAPEAVELCADKWRTQRLFEEHGLSVPKARLIKTGEEAAAAVSEIGYPLVVKPCCASDCSGVRLVQRESELAPALEEAGVKHGPVLIQKYIHGQAASVSILAAKEGVKELALNLQHIDDSDGFTYLGGVANISHPMREMAFNLALKAVSLIPGINGFCGVDMVFQGNRAWLMEINPRVTTSFTGLAKAFGPNLARALWEACANGKLANRMDYLGEVSFAGEACDD